MLVIRTLVISQIRSEHLSVSIDPYTGRNPSYAFVDLTTSADAQRAISELNGREMLGRPMKRLNLEWPGRLVVRMVHLRTLKESLPSNAYRKSWILSSLIELSTAKQVDEGVCGTGGKNLSSRQRPILITHKLKEESTLETCLPLTWNLQGSTPRSKEFFCGFQMYTFYKLCCIETASISSCRQAVSKIIPPHVSNLSSGYYVFVDFSTADEASRAVRALHGTQSWDRAVKVSWPSRSILGRLKSGTSTSHSLEPLDDTKLEFHYHYAPQGRFKLWAPKKVLYKGK